MAEFASAIVGLVAFGATVGNSLYTLIDTLKDAPNELLALSDEVTDFRSILSQLLEAQSSEEFAHHSCLNDLQESERKGRNILEKVEILIQNIVKEKSPAAHATKLDRVRWLRYAKKAAKLQISLRTQKATISSFLAMGILKSSARQGLLISRLETKIDGIAQSQLALVQKQGEMVAGLAQFQLISEQPKPTEPLLMKNTSSHIYTTPSTRITKHPKNIPQECFPDCSCRCHFKAIIRSPQHLSGCLGDFFLGCSNLPWSFSGVVPCSERTCRRSRLTISELRYFLPTWFGKVLGALNITVNFHLIPFTINIQSRHTIPYDSQILVCTQNGDIEGIRRLLKSGQASLNDVDPYGLGLLYYAVYYCQRALGKETAIRTCQLLLDMGAHPEWEDEIGNTAMENMIDDTIVSLAVDSRNTHSPTLTDFLHISILFDIPAVDLSNDFIEDRGFTMVHQVLLGIRRDLGKLDQYLSDLRQQGAVLEGIDEPDSCGRSALAWAVEHRWPDAVETLLQFGANPSQSRPSIHGRLPLLHLAIAGPPAADAENDLVCVVRSLLHAGVDINAIDHEGWTPLHVAASWNNYQIINELAVHGYVDIDWDAVTDDSQSAIDLALGGGFNAEVQEILQTHRPNRIVVEEESQSDSGSDEFVDCISDFTERA